LNVADYQKYGENKLMNDEPLWTVQEVADFLRIKPESVRGWARTGRLPGLKIGAKRRSDWRFFPNKIRNFLETQENLMKKQEE
jgi:excisionase family DNA binding protein